MQFYFLFLESIGTPEMILIAFVALMIFGPRKLPNIGRTIGKYTTEFKRASNEFRRNWESEVEAAEREEKLAQATNSENQTNKSEDFSVVENTIGRSSPRRQTNEFDDSSRATESDLIALPEIRAVSQKDFQNDFAADANAAAQIKKSTEFKPAAPKREWL